MHYFVSALLFCFITLFVFTLTVFIYIKMVIAVKHNKDVPGWIYKIGHAMKGRGRDYYEDITDASALKEVNLFLLGLTLAHIIVVAVMYFRGQSLPEAIYFCLKGELFMVVGIRMLWMICKTISLITGIARKTSEKKHEYASTNAVIGMVLMTAFSFMMTVFMTGIPAKPVEVSIAESRITIGSTKASELLNAGFSFYTKNADTEIVNRRDSYFQYGELAEITRDGKSYGIVSLTPEWGDKDKLKDCVITYYGISADSEQLGNIKINNTSISKLKYDDFKNRKLTDVFSITPGDYKESKNDFNFSLQLQTNSYMLWKRYTIKVNFNEDYKAVQYEVMAQQTIWE